MFIQFQCWFVGAAVVRLLLNVRCGINKQLDLMYLSIV